jgi:SAC3/GANP family
MSVTNYESRKRQERAQRFSTTATTATSKKRKVKLLPTTTTTQITDNHQNIEDDDDGSTIPFSSSYDIVGQNMEIEKSYLRLTTFPKWEDVRPLPVLIKALEHVKRKYQQNDDFTWCDDQLRSIRQDITVQKSHIPTHHVIVLDTYQTHARILLEHGHLTAFNQCLSNVLQIYDAMHSTLDPNNVVTNDNRKTGAVANLMKAEGEFRAYSILYSLVQSKTSFLDLNLALRRRQEQFLQRLLPKKLIVDGQGTTTASNNHRKKNKKRHRQSSRSVVTEIVNGTNSSGTSDKDEVLLKTIPMSNIRDNLMTNRMSDEEKHAWDVVHSIYDGRYTHFFVLYDSAPHMSPYLLDFLLHRLRLHAYSVIVTSYRPSVSIEFIQTALHFDSQPETQHFLQQRHAVFCTPSPGEESGTTHSNDDKSKSLIDCRQSQQMLQSNDA